MPFHVLETLFRFDLWTCISSSVCANRQYQGSISEIIDLISTNNLMDAALICGCPLFLPNLHFLLWGIPAGER